MDGTWFVWQPVFENRKLISYNLDVLDPSLYVPWCICASFLFSCRAYAPLQWSYCMSYQQYHRAQPYRHLPQCHHGNASVSWSLWIYQPHNSVSHSHSFICQPDRGSSAIPGCRVHHEWLISPRVRCKLPFIRRWISISTPRYRRWTSTVVNSRQRKCNLKFSPYSNLLWNEIQQATLLSYKVFWNFVLPHNCYCKPNFPTISSCSDRIAEALVVKHLYDRVWWACKYILRASSAGGHDFLMSITRKNWNIRTRGAAGAWTSAWLGHHSGCCERFCFWGHKGKWGPWMLASGMPLNKHSLFIRLKHVVQWNPKHLAPFSKIRHIGRTLSDLE